MTLRTLQHSVNSSLNYTDEDKIKVINDSRDGEHWFGSDAAGSVKETVSCGILVSLFAVPKRDLEDGEHEE